MYFYYEPTDGCDPVEEKGDDGKVVIAGSEEYPSYLPDVKCDFHCREDGYHATIDVAEME